MRKIASLTIEDPTCDATMSERGVPYLFAGCGLFLLFVLIAASIGRAMFEPWVFFWCIVALISSLGAGVSAARIFHFREMEFGNKCRRVIRKAIDSGLAGTDAEDDDELRAWLESECLMRLGGATDEPACVTEDNRAYIALFDKSEEKKLLVEILFGEILEDEGEGRAEPEVTTDEEDEQSTEEEKLESGETETAVDDVLHKGEPAPAPMYGPAAPEPDTDEA